MAGGHFETTTYQSMADGHFETTTYQAMADGHFDYFQFVNIMNKPAILSYIIPDEHF